LHEPRTATALRQPLRKTSANQHRPGGSGRRTTAAMAPSSCRPSPRSQDLGTSLLSLDVAPSLPTAAKVYLKVCRPLPRLAPRSADERQGLSFCLRMAEDRFRSLSIALDRSRSLPLCLTLCLSLCLQIAADRCRCLQIATIVSGCSVTLARSACRFDSGCSTFQLLEYEHVEI